MKARQLLTTAVLGIMAIGLSGLVSAGKPEKPPGKTENASGRITINVTDAGYGLIGDGMQADIYLDSLASGSPDCLLIAVPSSDGVDQGRVTMFHRHPDSSKCDGSQSANRSFGVSLSDFDLNSNEDNIDGDGTYQPEPELSGQFRCWYVFDADSSGAYCWFRIFEDGTDTALRRIEWPSVTVTGSGDTRTVTSSGGDNAAIYKLVEVPGNGKKVKTEMQLQGTESIPLDFDVERL